MPEDSKIENTIPLTDPVVEDISRSNANTVPPPTRSQPENISPSPIISPLPRPAIVPVKTNPSLTTPLIIITLLALAAAGFFYTKNKQLKNQVQDLTNTVDIESSPSPTQFPSTPPSTAPTAIAPSNNLSLFNIAPQTLSLAQQKYPQAQLILITADNPHQKDLSISKFWFRQAPNTKKYLYISSQTTGFNLIDQQVFVSPDNQIPSLNEKLKVNQLGADLPEILSLTNSLCPDPEKCQQASAINAQFLQTPTNLLWQISYQIEANTNPIIFQVNSQTKEIVYQSENPINK